MSDIKKHLNIAEGFQYSVNIEYDLGNEEKIKGNLINFRDFETSIKGLRAIGDGAAATRGLMQASANGISVARSIVKRMEEEK